MGSDPPGGPSHEAPRPRANEAHLLTLKHRPEEQASNLAQLRACWLVGIVLRLYLGLTLASELRPLVVVVLFLFPAGTICMRSLCLIAAGGHRLHTPRSALQSTSISCRGAFTRVCGPVFMAAARGFRLITWLWRVGGFRSWVSQD